MSCVAMTKHNFHDDFINRALVVKFKRWLSGRQMSVSMSTVLQSWTDWRYIWRVANSSMVIVCMLKKQAGAIWFSNFAAPLITTSQRIVPCPRLHCQFSCPALFCLRGPPSTSKKMTIEDLLTSSRVRHPAKSDIQPAEWHPAEFCFWFFTTQNFVFRPEY